MRTAEQKEHYAEGARERRRRQRAGLNKIRVARDLLRVGAVELAGEHQTLLEALALWVETVAKLEAKKMNGAGRRLRQTQNGSQ